jgi:hypothetical protein
MIQRRGIALMLVNFAMFGGMLFARLLGTLFVPMLFAGIERLVQRVREPLSGAGDKPTRAIVKASTD